jgi:RNA polymerase sigma factor (sigma-70 family)
MVTSGSERARVEGLVRKHAWLIGLLARRRGWYKRGIPHPHLVQAGLVGLWTAARGFDEARGVKFASYAGTFVLGEFRRELRVVQGERHEQVNEAVSVSDARSWEFDTIRRIDAAARLRLATATMGERDINIVRAVLQDGLTPAETARRFGLSRVRVGQILERTAAAARAVAGP